MPDQQDMCYKLPILLPQRFCTNADKQRLILKHSSQLIAWSWCSLFAYQHDPDPKKLEQEQALKNLLVKLLKKQGNQLIAYHNCGDSAEMGRIKKTSDNIKYLLSAQNDRIEIFGDSDVRKIKETGSITLKDVLNKLSQEDLAFADSSEYVKDFLDNTLFLVSFEIYGGQVYRNAEDDDKKDAEIPEYVAVFPYPPRPREYTITENHIMQWAQGKKDPDDLTYMPPAYIPSLSSS